MSLVSASTIPGYVLRYRSHAMDGVYSIVAGLVLRVVVDAATFHDVKLSGTLIGLWEGVVLLHYVNKAPASSDPYLAYGVRLFVDFLVTESIFKTVVVLLWTTMGMVLADVAPAVWVDMGLKRQWSRVRRDLYRWARTFSKRRTPTVRFVSTPTIASTARSIVSDVESSVDGESTVATTVYPASTTAPSTARDAPESPTILTIPVTPPVQQPVAMRRRSSVPGTFPGAELSETDTGTVAEEDESESEEVAAPIFSPQPSHITIARIIPLEPSEDSYTYTTSPRSSSPAYSLEYSDDPSASNPLDIPDLEEEVLVHSHRRGITPNNRETTPKQLVVVLPPTPSDSLRDWESSHGDEVPPSPWMPHIPDSDHEPLDEWETVNAVDEAPPAPPPKDVIFETVSVNEENDDASIATGSTVAPQPVPNEPIAPTEDPNPPLVAMPVPDPAPLVIFDSPIIIPPDLAPPPLSDLAMPVPDIAPPIETSEDQPSDPPQPTLDPAPDPDPNAPQDPPVPEVDAPPPAPVADPDVLQEPLVPVFDPEAPQYSFLQTGDVVHTPPPSFKDLYGSEGGSDAQPVTDVAEPPPRPLTEPAASQHASRPTTPTLSLPSGSLSRALGLRKEALEIKARIAALDRQRKSSLMESNSVAAAAAVLAKVEMDRAEKELAQVNEKAAGAFVGAYNPPSASLYEFNTTGLTPEEAVLQTEVRLEKLLLTPVPPVGTRPEDLVHDSPNRGVLKVIMEQTIKGRLVKVKLLDALNGNGLNWLEEPSRPNVVNVLLPVSAATEEPPATAAESEPPPKKDEDEESTKEY